MPRSRLQGNYRTEQNRDEIRRRPSDGAMQLTKTFVKDASGGKPETN